MRILQIMNRVPWPLKDGGALGYYQYTKGYAEAGCEVTVCALNTNKHHVNMEALPNELTSIATWHATDINTDVSPVPALLNLFSSRSYNLQRFESNAFETLLSQVIQNNPPFDVIIFESLFVASYLPLVRKLTSSLCILREHNVEYKIWETLAAGEKNILKKSYLKLLASRMKSEEMKAWNQFDGITTVTADDADHFKQLGCNKPLFVSPFGADLKRLVQDNSIPEPFSVFHLGSMEWMPNQEAMTWFMEKVWPMVIQENPQATLWVAGRGMPESFKAYQSNSIHIVGEVEDAPSFIRSKQIMIVPLFSGSGIRVKILEGMALGKAIVTTSLGAAGIDVQNGKHLIFANTAEEFAKAINELLQHPEKVKALGNQAAQLASDKYDNTKVIQQVLSFYSSLKKK